jgi:DNA polymerase V
MRTQTLEYSEITLYSVSEFQPIFALKVESSSSTTGFTSPADDYIDAHLDVNEYHRIRKHTTFLEMAVGDSMIDAEIALGLPVEIGNNCK